jgi:hypothetical protein
MKILDVCFKTRKLNFTYETNQEEKEAVAKQVCEAFRTSLPKIKKLTEGDEEFQTYCVKVLAGIISRLRDSI